MFASPEERQQDTRLHRLRQGVGDHGAGRDPAGLERNFVAHGLLDHGGDDSKPLVSRLAHI
eukprot:7206537-Pyramimonas_sp.AAC.1